MVDKSKRKTICTHCMKIIPDNQPCECRKQSQRDTNKRKEEMNPEEKKFFNSTRWKKLRKRILDRDNGHCQRCLIKYGVIVTKNLEAHHIKPRSKYPDLRWDEDNLITLCKLCNTSIGTREILDFKFTFPEQKDYFL